MATQKRKTIALNPLKDIKSKAGSTVESANPSSVKKPPAKASPKISSVKKSADASEPKKLKTSSSKVAAKPDSDADKNLGAKNDSVSARGAVIPEGASEIFEAELSLISAPTHDALFADGLSYELGQKTVIKWSRISLATILLPNSILEYAAISGVQLKMLHDLSRIYGIPFKADAVKVIIGSILGGSVAYFLSDIYANWVKVIPVVGKPIAFLTEPAMAYVTTYAVGYVFLEHFENNGSFQDIELETMKKTIKLKISEKYKELIKNNKLTGSKRFFGVKDVPA